MPPHTEGVSDSAGHVLRGAVSSLEAFRALAPDAPVQFLSAFLAVALHRAEHGDWPYIADMKDRLGLTQQAASRIVAALSDGPRGRAGAQTRRPGLQLIEKRAVPNDRRLVQLAITPKGESLLAQFLALVD